jgi:hypothetical protein
MVRLHPAKPVLRTPFPMLALPDVPLVLRLIDVERVHLVDPLVNRSRARLDNL